MSVRLIVAILGADHVRGQVLEQALRDPNRAVTVCESSDQLAKMMQTQRVDVLVVDHELEGFLSGLDIIEKLLQDLVRPAVVLAGNLTPDEKKRADEAKIQSVIDPTSTPEQVAKKVNEAVRAAKTLGIDIPHEARVLVRNAERIPPMPQVLAQLAGFLGDPDVSAPEVSGVLETDPKITAQVMKLINSSAFGLRQKITRIADAINLLGVQRALFLILSSQVFERSQAIAADLPEDFLKWFRSRSVLIGSVASALAQEVEDADSESAYILGLLQDIGILVLAQQIGDPYLRIVQRFRSVAQIQFDACEGAELNYHHADVSAAVLQRWELPGSLVRTTLLHHDTKVKDLSHRELETLKILRASEAFSALKDIPSPQRQLAFDRLIEPLGLPPETIQNCLASGIKKATEFQAILNLPEFDLEGLHELLKQMESIEEISVTPEDKIELMRSLKILAVDDDELLLGMIKEYLGEEVEDIETTLDPRELTERANDFDLILCDVHLGDESGIDVVNMMRGHGIKTPVMMMTADRSRKTVMESLRVGICDFLVKPFDRDYLLDRVTKQSMKLQMVNSE